MQHMCVGRPLGDIMARLTVCFLSLCILGGALCQLILPWQACEMQCLKENNATYPFHATQEISEHCHTYCQTHWQDMFNNVLDKNLG